MPPNAARIAQIGNLLTSPVFAAALLGVLINLAGPLGLHLTSDPAFQQNAAILIAGLGVVLTHWYTGPVSITSTTLIPSTPVAMPAGTGVVTTGTAAVPGIAFMPLSPTAPGFGHTVQVPVEPRPSTAPSVIVRTQEPLPAPPAAQQQAPVAPGSLVTSPITVAAQG